MLRLFNTKTRNIEEFVALKRHKVRMYSCGPTVYSSPHIGNLRAYVFVDTLRRTLEANGYEVTHVMNITDVGHLFEEGEEGRIGQDKLEYEASKEHLSVWDIAKQYTEEFLEALDALNIKQPTTIPRATDHIPEMIQLIETLEKKSFTYKIDDGIYFDTSKFPNYGALAGGKKGIQAGARVEIVEGKKNPTDFALWKFSPKDKKRQMEWESPWGVGFPGWHIECSAMSMKYLSGERSRTIDIHTGGIDHIPVHHTNEIAQSEGATEKEFVRFWLHNEFVLVDGRKMSKSLGNVYTLRDIQKKGFDPLALRYLFLTAHYREKLNFTWESLEAAQIAYHKLVSQILNLKSKISRKALPEDKLQSIEKYREEFFNQINGNLGTPGVLATMWEMVKSNIPSKDKQELLFSFDEVLGLNLEQKVKSKKQKTEIPQDVKKLVEEREELREKEKWDKADEIRTKVEGMGYLIEDTSGGPQVKPKTIPAYGQ